VSLQKAIEMSAKLYQCRDQAIWLQGPEKFQNMVEKWKPTFEAVMKGDSCNELQALTVLLKRVKQQHLDSDGLLAHLLTAVACELSEPSLPNKPNVERQTALLR